MKGSLRTANSSNTIAFWFGFPFFEWDKEFHIRDSGPHSVTWKLRKETISESNLQEFIRSRFKAPFRRGNSLWEIFFVSNCNNENKTLFFTDKITKLEMATVL